MGRKTIIIGVLVIALFPHPSSGKVIYEQPVRSPAPKIETVKNATPLPDTKLVAQAEVAPVAPPTPPAPVYVPPPVQEYVPGCGDNFYANYIYMHESGCRTTAVNPGGCRGIGQACPGSKLPCGADYACQNAWFTNYANSAYGGWAGAYAFWLGHSWW